MTVRITFTLSLTVDDAVAFRKAAYERARESMTDEEGASDYLDITSTSLGDCAVMLLDPGSLPGAEIQDSTSAEF